MTMKYLNIERVCCGSDNDCRLLGLSYQCIVCFALQQQTIKGGMRVWYQISEASPTVGMTNHTFWNQIFWNGDNLKRMILNIWGIIWYNKLYNLKQNILKCRQLKTYDTKYLRHLQVPNPSQEIEFITLALILPWYREKLLFNVQGDFFKVKVRKT